jgi:hypothetical protein
MPAFRDSRCLEFSFLSFELLLLANVSDGWVELKTQHVKQWALDLGGARWDDLKTACLGLEP